MSGPRMQVASVVLGAPQPSRLAAEASVAWAVQTGAALAEHQPREHVRVMLDPAGHPFCLFHGPVD